MWEPQSFAGAGGLVLAQLWGWRVSQLTVLPCEEQPCDLGDTEPVLCPAGPLDGTWLPRFSWRWSRILLCNAPTLWGSQRLLIPVENSCSMTHSTDRTAWLTERVSARHVLLRPSWRCVCPCCIVSFVHKGWGEMFMQGGCSGALCRHDLTVLGWAGGEGLR